MVRSRRRRRSQRGFTLIEIMFVVVIIAVLAVIAIPQFTEQSNKTKSRAEVTAFFAELQKREEQFKIDSPTSVYYPTAPGATTCPASGTPGSTPVTLDCTAPTKPWVGLNVLLPTPSAYCYYTITSGSGAATAGSGCGVTTWVFTAAANTSWYHICAICDIDGDGTQVKFFTSSQSSDIQVNGTEGE